MARPPRRVHRGRRGRLSRLRRARRPPARRAVRGVALRAPLLQGPARHRRRLAAPRADVRSRATRECVEYGALLLREAETRPRRRTTSTRRPTWPNEARGLGRALRSPDLEAEALQTAGRVLIDEGDSAEGLGHLDEAMLFAVEGRLRPVLDRQGVLQPDQRLRGRSATSAARPSGREATRRWAQRHPVRHLPGDLPGAPGGRARAARRAGRGRAGGEPGV